MIRPISYHSGANLTQCGISCDSDIFFKLLRLSFFLLSRYGRFEKIGGGCFSDVDEQMNVVIYLRQSKLMINYTPL